MTYVSGSREINMVATIKSNQVQETQRLNEEGLITANARQGRALAEFSPKWDLYWTRLALLLEPSKSEGKAVCELEETYRANDKGIYAIHLEGIVESGPIPVNTIKSDLEISIEVRSGEDNSVLGRMHKIIRSREFTIDGNQQLWMSPAEELKPLKIEIKAGVQYFVYSSVALSAQSDSRTNNIPTSIDGKFRIIVESLDKVQRREKIAKSLSRKLTELWVKEDAKLNNDPQLQEASQSLAMLFLNEAVRYVDIHVPPHNRQACFEHARIVREWYEIRMRLNSNLARWFRMTTVRRNTPFLWQSSNLITPNVSTLPDRWLDDGTGIILEPKPAGIGNFYGRYISAKEFCMMGLRPKIQQTARIPSLNIE